MTITIKSKQQTCEYYIGILQLTCLRRVLHNG